MSQPRRHPGSMRTRRFYTTGRKYHCGCWHCLRGKTKRRIIRDRIHEAEMRQYH